MTPPPRPLWQTFRLLGPPLGFVIWSAGFVALYSMQALGCGLGWDAVLLPFGLSLQRAQLVVILLALLIVLAALTWLSVRITTNASSQRTDRFLRYATSAGLVAALAASVFTFAPTAILSACNGFPPA